jgi:lysophospholipase L1-like esterase
VRTQNRFQRRSPTRWAGRLLLLLLSCELGLRIAGVVAPRLLARPASSNGAIVCVGDSNTFGLGAPPGRSYPDQLREMLAAGGTPRDVVNLGILGFRSTEALDRLEDALREATPSCVIYLAGANDRSHDDHLFPPDADTPAARAHAWLRESATVRVAEAGYHVLRGDLAREEFGGRERPRFDPKKLLVRDFDANYPAAKAAGVDGVFAWLSQCWHHERPELAERVWRDFAADPRFQRIVARFQLPLAAYEWELARLNHRAHAPLAGSDAAGFQGEFARFTAAIDDLEHGRLEAARAGFLSLAEGNRDPIWEAFLRMHAGWALLMMRDFRGAARELAAQADQIAACSPFVGLAWDLGAAAVAAQLAEPATDLAAFTAVRADSWEKARGSERSPLAREWIFASELIDATRRDDPDDRARAARVCKRSLGSPRSAPLRWLLAHPEARLAAIRSDLPLEPPLASWIGPIRDFLATTSDEELRRSLEQSAIRLDALESRHGFRVLALTYLDYEKSECNRCIRQLARDHHWELVDLHAIWPESELGRDDKTRYFCPDRGHPNEAGYGLMARAIRDELARLGIAK